MRKTGAFVWLGALVTGLVLMAGLAAAQGTRAGDRGTPWLGVYMQELTPDLREGIDYQGVGGVLVSDVVSGGPADRAGIRKGDVILRVNSRKVDSPAELQDIVRSARVGQNLAVQVYRDGSERDFSVNLRERPADQEMESPEGTEPESPETPVEPMPPMGNMRMPDVRMFSMMGDRGRLGVRIESLNPELGDYFGMRDGRGVLVLEVMDDTPAQRAGLRSGDVITRVDDRSVAKAEDLVDALRGKEGNVSLRVVRHGTPRTLQATLERGPNSGRSMRMMAPAPGARQSREEMRREIDQLRQQIDELQRRMEEQGGGGD